MAARKRKPEPETMSPAQVDAGLERIRVAVQPPSRMILRCHRERDQVQDIETTPGELRDGVDVPLYTLRVQIV